MFFGLLGDSTPRYQGPGASAARERSGVLGFLVGLLGGTGTPVYAGAGQPPRERGIGLRLFGGSPAYAQPTVEPVMPATPEAAEREGTPEAKRTTVTIIVESDSDAADVGPLQSLQDRVLDD